MATSCVAEPAVVTDPDRVALEFEAIIAANFPPRSAGRVLRCPPVVRRVVTVWIRRRGAAARPHRATNDEPRIADRRPRARQRSPP